MSISPSQVKQDTERSEAETIFWRKEKFKYESNEVNFKKSKAQKKIFEELQNTEKPKMVDKPKPVKKEATVDDS